MFGMPCWAASFGLRGLAAIASPTFAMPRFFLTGRGDPPPQSGRPADETKGTHGGHPPLLDTAKTCRGRRPRAEETPRAAHRSKRICMGRGHRRRVRSVSGLDGVAPTADLPVQDPVRGSVGTARRVNLQSCSCTTDFSADVCLRENHHVSVPLTFVPPCFRLDARLTRRILAT